MIAKLKTCNLFGPLDDHALRPLAEIASERTLCDGQWLFRSGEEASAIYIIIDGELAVLAELRGRSEQLAVLRAKDAVAEAALLDPYAHGSSGQALSELTLLELPAEKARAALRENAATATAVLGQVARTMYSRMRYQSSRRWGLERSYDSAKTRGEHDLLGDMDVPAEALYGVQTLRATQNFDITGIKLSHFPRFLVALAKVKQACARANHSLGLLDDKIAAAIDAACQEIIEGRWHGHFVVDMVQGGAGTSTNMNANEVIANRALELLGYERGQYEHCHPNNHVNLGQSTNDVYPTAIRLAVIDASQPLSRALTDLQQALRKKGEEFAGVLKMGRTQLQDAVPMTLGQELEAFASTTGEDIERVEEAATLFLESSLGGTAIGTGINADPEYAPRALAKLREISGLALEPSPNLVEATPDTGAFVSFSGVLKRIAVKLSKLCNDLRLLSSGPRCGFNEINLPPMQPGSSIMPGKVNPVIPEVVNQIAFQVIGNDLTITMAAEAGQLQLNVMEPIIVFNIFQSIEMLTTGINVLVKRCINGITANAERSRMLVEGSIGIITALVPTLGYERAGDVAKAALESNRSVREIVLERGYLAAEVLDDLLSIDKMTAPR
jgi:aspartate ammonia-lyase